MGGKHIARSEGGEAENLEGVTTVAREHRKKMIYCLP